jgi:beta-glucanase (GH16 family)
VNTIERAIDAQAQYMEGTLPASELAKTWGPAAEAARRQADRMIFYRDGEISGVTITDAIWELEDCQVLDEPAQDRAGVGTSETWVYEAELRCSSGVVHNSTWIETYPAETYILVWVEGEWQISEWYLGAQRILTIDHWRCP